jgi:RNase P subunit RPR2
MNNQRFKQIKDQRKRIAIERIEILEEMIKKKPEFAERYRKLIKRLEDKYRLGKDF